MLRLWGHCARTMDEQSKIGSIIRRMNEEFAAIDAYYEGEGWEEGLYYEEGGEEEGYDCEEEEEGHYYEEGGGEEGEEEEEEQSQPRGHQPTPQNTSTSSLAAGGVRLPTLDRSGQRLEEWPKECYDRPWIKRLLVSRNMLPSPPVGQPFFSSLSQLEDLDVGHNVISELDLSQLAQPSILCTLRIPANPLKSIRWPSVPLSALHTLCMCHLPPSCQWPQMLQSNSVQLPSLQTLCCRISPLQSLQPFQKLTALKTLQMQHSPALRSLSPPLSSLTALHCDYCVAIDTDCAPLIAPCAKLSTLTLSNCPLLPSCPHGPSLTHLDVSRCTSIHKTNLPGWNLLPSLKVFRASHCMLSALPPFSDAASPPLEELRVPGNNLTQLPSHLPQSLLVLDVTWNNLSSLPNLPSSLHTLQCSFNSITKLPNPLPASLHTLQCAYNAQLGGAVPSIPSLRHIHCARAPSLDVSSHLIPSCFTSLSTLRASHHAQMIDMSQCAALRAIDVAFASRVRFPQSLPSLADLDCSFAPTCHLPASAFRLPAGAEDAQDVHPLENAQPQPSFSPWSFGASDMLGLRPTMEDSWSLIRKPTCDVFVLCDGHAASDAAIFVSSNLSRMLAEDCDRITPELIRQRFSECDNALRTHLSSPSVTSPSARHCGTTCVALTLNHATRTLHCSNVGDSRCVLLTPPDATSQGLPRVKRLSRDHKPGDPSELGRIREGGGHVDEVTLRVEGTLSVSRSLGDYRLRPAVDPTPNINGPLAYPAASSLLVVACDGVFDVLNDADLARLLVGAGHSWPPHPDDAARTIRDAAFLLGSDDNISVACAVLLK